MGRLHVLEEGLRRERLGAWAVQPVVKDAVMAGFACLDSSDSTLERRIAFAKMQALSGWRSRLHRRLLFLWNLLRQGSGQFLKLT